MTISSASLFIRSLFISTWVSVIAQIVFVLDGAHRFEALAKTNTFLTVIYMLHFLAIPFLFPKIRIPGKTYVFLFSALVCFAAGSAFVNPPKAVFVDFVLISLQFIFFFYGWSFRDVLDDERLLKTILVENLLISVGLGIFVWFFPFDLVSPMFGVFALAVFCCRRYGGSFTWILLFVLVSMNIFWSFGKQTILISLLGILISFWPRKGIRETIRIERLVLPGAIGIFLALVLTVVLGAAQYIYGGTDFGAIRKTVLFIDALNFDVGFNVLLNSPQLAYGVFDASTAGRIYEFIIAWSVNAESAITTFFGSGLGATLDLSGKNELADLASYEFRETRSVQTLPVFLLTRLGLLGVLGGVLVAVRYLIIRRASAQLIGPFFVCLFLSVLAFSSVFKYPFLGFFWGAMAATFAKIKFEKGRRGRAGLNEAV